MPVRIIKEGSVQAGMVNHLSFYNSGEEPNPNTATEPFRAGIADEQSGAGSQPNSPGPEQPSVDLAQVEKTAYENGFRQGEKAGIEIGEKKVQVVMRSYADAILELGKVKSSLYVKVEREVVKLALEVAKKIVHREIQADREVVQTLVKVALGHVAEKSAVTVHLNPVDYDYLLERRTNLPGGEGHEVILFADKSIERGGCLVETECGDVDARIEEEFRDVEQSFFGGLK